jgi:hypothetical protein
MKLNQWRPRDLGPSSRRKAIAMHQTTAIAIGFTAMFLTSTTASAQNNVDVITTSGSGKLITCRSWIVYNACTTHKVILLERISVDDHLELSFGSNPKNYTFHITVSGSMARAAELSAAPAAVTRTARSSTFHTVVPRQNRRPGSVGRRRTGSRSGVAASRLGERSGRGHASRRGYYETDRNLTSFFSSTAQVSCPVI